MRGAVKSHSAKPEKEKVQEKKKKKKKKKIPAANIFCSFVPDPAEMDSTPHPVVLSVSSNDPTAWNPARARNGCNDLTILQAPSLQDTAPYCVDAQTVKNTKSNNTI
jgi:hypothetical protein